jgi:hypothetical protein
MTNLRKIIDRTLLTIGVFGCFVTSYACLRQSHVEEGMWHAKNVICPIDSKDSTRIKLAEDIKKI